MTHINPRPETQDLVARFEPARATCRPDACIELPGCWVKTTRCSPASAGAPRCYGCQGRIKPQSWQLTAALAKLGCFDV
jgi:hypothetical protein